MATPTVFGKHAVADVPAVHAQLLVDLVSDRDSPHDDAVDVCE